VGRKSLSVDLENDVCVLFALQQLPKMLGDVGRRHLDLGDTGDPWFLTSLAMVMTH
jgi:hypothetical protein